MAIETNLIAADSFRLVLTGKLGDVMKESAQAALSYIRSNIEELGINKELLVKYELHVHVPAGAIPKDGPSAGTAIATSILSALLNRAPRSRTSMTGEITIHGKVLAIGGLKEKLLAAQREGIETVILPEKNRANFNEMPVGLKKKLKVFFVKEYKEVFGLVFGKADELTPSGEVSSDIEVDAQVEVAA